LASARRPRPLEGRAQPIRVRLARRRRRRRRQPDRVGPEEGFFKVQLDLGSQKASRVALRVARAPGEGCARAGRQARKGVGVASGQGRRRRRGRRERLTIRGRFATVEGSRRQQRQRPGDDRRDGSRRPERRLPGGGDAARGSRRRRARGRAAVHLERGPDARPEEEAEVWRKDLSGLEIRCRPKKTESQPGEWEGRCRRCRRPSRQPSVVAPLSCLPHAERASRARAVNPSCRRGRDRPRSTGLSTGRPPRPSTTTRPPLSRTPSLLVVACRETARHLHVASSPSPLSARLGCAHRRRRCRRLLPPPPPPPLPPPLRRPGRQMVKTGLVISLTEPQVFLRGPATVSPVSALCLCMPWVEDRSQPVERARTSPEGGSTSPGSRPAGGHRDSDQTAVSACRHCLLVPVLVHQ
jgi:hypothetical protein